MTIPMQHGLVYGPVRSRRLGRSLGVNLLPGDDKVCNFNCPYCQYGWTPADTRAHLGELEWPAPARVAEAVEEALGSRPAVDRITLAGNGEPTLHPAFREIVERLRDVRDRRAPKARLAILSNSSTVAEREIAAALVRLDECYMKLDGGDDAMLRRLNGCTTGVEPIVQGLSALGGVILQSMFTRDADGRVDNTTDDAVAAWIVAVRRVRPIGVHVYTLDRPPAWSPLKRVPRPTLNAIASRVEALGIPASVFA